MMCGIVVSGHRHFLQPSSWVLCICSWIFHCVKSVIDAGSSMNPVNSSTLTPTQSSTSTLIRCSITSLSGRSKPSRTAVCSVIDDACQRLFVVWSFFWLCSFRGFFSVMLPCDCVNVTERLMSAHDACKRDEAMSFTTVRCLLDYIPFAAVTLQFLLIDTCTWWNSCCTRSFIGDLSLCFGHMFV